MCLDVFVYLMIVADSCCLWFCRDVGALVTWFGLIVFVFWLCGYGVD